MARLVFATRRLPWPPDNGPRIRAFQLCQGLARHFDTTLVAFEGGPAYDSAVATADDLRRELPGVTVQTVPYDGRTPGGARRNVLSRASDTFGHYGTPAMRVALRQLAPGAILHLEDPGVALPGLHAGATLTSYCSQNVEHRILRDIARRMPPAHRPFMELEWRKVLHEERRIWRGADLTLACSEIDAAAMRAGGARHVELTPNGSLEHARLPLPPLAREEPLRLLFVGALRYWPYGHGMRWFVTEALPLVREAAGPVAVDVVGEHDADVARAPEVVYHGRVPEIVPFYERAHALLLPVFEGSGTRLKVVEAAMLGRPVVSTRLGVEGLPIGDAWFQAEDAEGFAAALARLRAQWPAEATVAAARERLSALTWRRIAADLAELYSTSVR